MRYLPILYFFASFSLYCKADTDLAFSGFGTLGITSTDSDNYGYRQNISKRNGIYSGEWKFEDASLIGLQLDLTFNKHFQFISQLVLKDRVEQSINNALELGFLRYNPSPAWSFRIGRTALDLFMMTEYRNIGFAYPWTHVPTEFYGIVPNQNLDGIDLSYTVELNKNLLRLKSFFGKSDSIIVTDDATLGANLEGIYGLSIDYEIGNHTIRGNYTHSKTRNNESNDIKQLKEYIASIPSFIWPDSKQAYDILSTDGKTFKYTTLGYKYSDMNWLIQSEVAQINSNSIAISKLKNAYLNISKKFNFNDIYIGYATTNSDYRHFSAEQPIIFKEISLIVENAMNVYATKQNTYSFGWRWHFLDNYSFKLQLDKTKVYKNRNTLWLSKTEAEENESVHTVSANISFIF